MSLPSNDRRQSDRQRVIYGGTIAYNQHSSTLNCVVQNFSPTGAKVTLDSVALLPDQVDLIINRKGRSFAAKIVWRTEYEAGLSFVPPVAVNPPVSLDWARRLRDCEAERRLLEARIDQLLSERGHGSA